MRALFLAQEAYSRFGGIQRFNARFIDALGQMTSADQLQAEVIMRRDAPQDLPEPGVPCLRMKACSGSAIRFAASAIVSSLSADQLILGHINLLPLGIVAKILRPGVRVLLIVHGIEAWGDAHFRAYRWWEPVALRLCVHRLLSVSHYTANKLREFTNFPTERISIFPNVVDAEEGWDQVEDEGVGTQLLTVTRLGEGEHKKRVDIIIAAVYTLRMSGIACTLNIVGDGVLREGLEQIANSLGLKSQVVFHGQVSDDTLKTLYGEADVFVLPSEKEGFGIVYLEAWKAGLPVVAARATAIPEVIDDGVDGILVSPVTPTTLSQAIGELLRNGQLRAGMVNNGRKKILEKYNGKSFVDRLRIALVP